MKIRRGFVSNSSSSSFVCEICNHTESGWDFSPRDAGFVECENGHIFCDSHALNLDPSENEDVDITPSGCPICQFQEPSYPDLREYLKKVTGITDATVFEEIKKVNKRRKVLRPHEYVEYVLREQNKTIDGLLVELKAEYKTYSKFMGY